MGRRGRPRKLGTEQQPVQQPAALQEAVPSVEPVAREPLEIVEKRHTCCPYCGSVRSKLVHSRPGADGRMEWRRCKSCCRPFKVWDSKYGKPP